MIDNRYKVKNKFYDKRLGIFGILVRDFDTNEDFNVYMDEDQFLLIKNGVDEKDLYLAYIDYIETHEFNYYYKQHQLETIPKKYVQMYYHFDEYYKANYDKNVNDKLNKVMQYLGEIKDYLNIEGEESAQSYYNKTSRINTAEFELSKIKKLSK